MQTEVIQAGAIQGKRGINSAVLKNIAVVTMLIDHIGAVIMTRLLIRNGLYEAMVNQEAYTAWMGQNGGMYGIYMAMRIIGRLAFPIYCFLLVEGFQKTHNVKKYLGRMFLFALISEVPFDLAFSGKAWYPAYQNVFFTLLLGLLVLLNTVGGDVEAGLALAELIASISKPSATLVLGGGHSIGIPLAVSARHSFIVPTATMTVHPVRHSGLILGVPQTMHCFEQMQQRITGFVAAHSGMPEKRYTQLMLHTGELVMDMGTVLDGRRAVKEKLIDELGGLSDALAWLYGEIERG